MSQLEKKGSISWKLFRIPNIEFSAEQSQMAEGHLKN